MILSANTVSLQRNGTDLLKEVCATFAPGTVTAICGPNGAGKSTLLSCLAGLLAPSSGTVSLDGDHLSGLPAGERARRIGYLPQTGEIAWDLSVRNLVALGRMPHGDQGHSQVAAALAALDMTAFADRPVSTLSGGEKARALLARVLAGEPRWILADEPLTALDLAHQLTLLVRLRRIAAEGTGVALVLHDLAQAMNYADRVVVLECGAIAADGDPATVLSEKLIARIWNVSARWLGEPGQRALAIAGDADGL